MATALKSVRLTGTDPKVVHTVTVSIGMIYSGGHSKREINGYERDLRELVDRTVRDWFKLGPYSRAVETTAKTKFPQ
jgi:hypothetical protein